MWSKSKRLTRFLSEYLKWARAGAPVGDQTFDPSDGLCGNAVRWQQRVDPQFDAVPVMRRLFEMSYPSKQQLYPFGGRPLYVIESFNGTLHLNADRIAWCERGDQGPQHHKWKT